MHFTDSQHHEFPVPRIVMHPSDSWVLLGTAIHLFWESFNEYFVTFRCWLSFFLQPPQIEDNWSPEQDVLMQQKDDNWFRRFAAPQPRRGGGRWQSPAHPLWLFYCQTKNSAQKGSLVLSRIFLAQICCTIMQYNWRTKGAKLLTRKSLCCHGFFFRNVCNANSALSGYIFCRCSLQRYEPVGNTRTIASSMCKCPGSVPGLYLSAITRSPVGIYESKVLSRQAA